MISVVVPVYNAEKYLERCLGSLAGQAYRDMEVVMVNDGSTDGSGAVLERYAKRYANFRLIDKANGGPNDACIAGIEAAKGEYVGFVDADDFCDEAHFENIAEAISRSGADMIVFKATTFRCGENDSETEIVSRGGGNKLAEGLYVGRRLENVKTKYFEEQLFSAARWIKVVKKDLLENNKELFAKDVVLGEDIGFTASVLFDTQSLYVTDWDGYFYRINDSSITHRFGEARITQFGRLCANLKEVCEAKGYGIGIDTELKRQLMVLISMLLKADDKTSEKRRMLAKLRESDCVKEMIRSERMPDFTAAERWKYRLFKDKAFVPLLISAYINEMIRGRKNR